MISELLFKYKMSSRTCDTTALEECFKKHKFNRREHCKKEIEEFERKCAQLASTFRQRTTE